MQSHLILDIIPEVYSSEELLNKTVTVGDLIGFLQEFDQNTPIVIGNDRRYTFSSINLDHFHLVNNGDDEYNEEEY